MKSTHFKIFNLAEALLVLVLFIAPQLQAKEPIQLSEASFNNSVVMEVSSSKSQASGIKVRMQAKNLGEPAATPIYIDLSVRCPGDKQSKRIDIAKLVAQESPEVFNYYRELFSGLDARNPGRFRACAFESLNFDENFIKLSVLKPGDMGCDQTETVDFLIPIKDQCPR